VSVKAVPLVRTSFTPLLLLVKSCVKQVYELAELNAAKPLRVIVLGPFVFGMVEVPVTTCCDD
jgi:hypothetical protein